MNSTKSTAATGSIQPDADERLKKQCCVLLVEDDRSVRRFLEVTLERSGYKVITARDGLEAMKQALLLEIDVVITDAIMPQLSGQELARFLRANSKLSKIPIVLLTGQENRDPTTTTGDLIDAFLYKPVKAEDLRNCLTGLLIKSDSTENYVKIN